MYFWILENVASRAFDPFLSNRMMREAASWDAKEEKDIFNNSIGFNYCFVKLL